MDEKEQVSDDEIDIKIEPDKMKKIAINTILVTILICGIIGGYVYGYREGYIYVDGWHNTYEKDFCLCYNYTTSPYLNYVSVIDRSNLSIV